MTARLSRTRTPWAGSFFWFTVVPIEETEQGTDLWAFSRGYISMTPLTLDLTEYDQLHLEAARPSPLTNPQPRKRPPSLEEEDEQP